MAKVTSGNGENAFVSLRFVHQRAPCIDPAYALRRSKRARKYLMHRNTGAEPSWPL
jgi:hypothetical protein